MTESKRKVYAIYFSPSGSTEKVVKKIAAPFEGFTVENINLLTSASRKKSYTFGHDDIAEGRPDADDMKKIQEFGKNACAKILGGGLELHNLPGTTSKEVAEIMRSFGEASTKRLEPEIFI